MTSVVYSRMRWFVASAQAAATLCIVGLAPSAAQGAFERVGPSGRERCSVDASYNWNFPGGLGFEIGLDDRGSDWRVTLAGENAAAAGAPAGSRDLTVTVEHLNSTRACDQLHDAGPQFTFDATNAGLGSLARGPAAPAPRPAPINATFQAPHGLDGLQQHWDYAYVRVQMARVGDLDARGNAVADATIRVHDEHARDQRPGVPVFKPSLHNRTQDRSGDVLDVRVTPGFRLPDGSVFDGVPIDLGTVAPGQEAEYPPLPATLGENPLSQYTMETRGASSPPGLGATFTSLAFVGGVNDTLSQLDLDGATELFVDAGHFYAPLFNVSDMNLFIAIDLTQIAGLDIDLSPGRVVNFDANGVGDIAGVMASATPFMFVPGAGWVTDSPISGSFTIAGWVDGSVIPEPSSIALLVLGSLVALRRR